MKKKKKKFMGGEGQMKGNLISNAFYKALPPPSNPIYFKFFKGTKNYFQATLKKSKNSLQIFPYKFPSKINIFLFSEKYRLIENETPIYGKHFPKITNQ